jgi:hypothetical protein
VLLGKRRSMISVASILHNHEAIIADHSMLIGFRPTLVRGRAGREAQGDCAGDPGISNLSAWSRRSMSCAGRP